MASGYDYHNTDPSGANPTSPYGSGDPYYNQSSGYIASGPQKKGRSNWIKFGIPVALLVVIGAVVGGVVGSRSKNNSSSSSGSSANPSSIVSIKDSVGRFATATDSDYFMPVYPSTTNSAAFGDPTFVPTTDTKTAWPQDPFQPSNPSPTSVRSDRPRLIAPAYKWAALPELIANDPYLSGWNASIFNNATQYFSLPPVVYHMDGASGILDNAREIKMRIKAFAYAYRMTNDTKWVDRTLTELQNAAGNGTTQFGPAGAPDLWNSPHFLDTAEFVAAFAIAYDWLYDIWTAEEKASIMFTMIKYGLSYGVQSYTNDVNFTGWWQTATEGNWNCVCNSGLTMGALAIIGDDTSGSAETLLGKTIPNAVQNCVFGVTSDGSWTETANYWYFGTTGHAEMTSSLLTATGSDFGLLNTNPQLKETGLFHMYVHGPTSLFDFGDHGPNKFSTTANSVTFYGGVYDIPEYQLYQRDMFDAPEPWSMFWYDPAVSGAFWDGLPLDHFFDNQLDQWGSMRSTWTDNDALYIAMKAGKLQGHQTHNDLDCGDFVLDALGTRWAGELGSGDYLSTGYFSNDTQNSERWLYYRKRTEGQNTILVNRQNQLVTATPTINYDSSNTTQAGGTTVFDVPNGSTAFFSADLSSAYSDVTSFHRGIRPINNRKQVLLQDDITTSEAIEWRMHTNATVTVSGTTATLTLEGQTMIVSIINPPSGATFATAQAVRFDTDPALPAGMVDQPNPGVTVLTIDLPAGTYSLQVLFNPQWSGMSSSNFVTPPSVPLSSWSLTSHN
jgi:hypothetical protein